MGKKNKAKSADKAADKEPDVPMSVSTEAPAAPDTTTDTSTPTTTNGIEAEEHLKVTEDSNEEGKTEALPGDLTTQAEEPPVAATEKAVEKVKEEEAKVEKDESNPETEVETESKLEAETESKPEAETESKPEAESKPATSSDATSSAPIDEPTTGDMSAETVEPTKLAEKTNGNAAPAISVTEAEKTEESNKAAAPAPASSGTSANASVSVRPSRAHSTAGSISSVNSTRSSMASSVFIKNSLNTISTSKEAKKNAALSTAVGKALSSLDRDENPSAQTIFEPMRLVCQGNDAEMQVVALDAIGKMFTYSFFEDPAPLPHNEEAGIVPPPRIPLIEQAITCVCEAHRGDATDQRVELQIVKALMAAVLNEEHIAHGATLLKAIRQSYNIFVTSPYQANQIVAQASISQMVNVVFERVKVNLKKKAIAADNNLDYVESTADILASSNGSSSDIKLNLSDLNRADVDDEDRVMEAKTSAGQDKSDIVAKDAFLVFRAMSKLSIKDIESDSVDIRSKEMRSKLLSLHLVHSILKSHMTVFLSKDVVIKSSGAAKNTTFVNAVRQYICLTLAKNASSITPAVFELSAEIFWLLLSNLRGQFKKEIDVVLTEVYFHIVEMKTSTAHQKLYFLGIISRLCNDPRALVEVFLNYDCTRGVGNIYETLINYLVRHATARIIMTPVQMQQYREWKHKPIAVYNTSLPPQLASANLTSTSYTPEVLPYPVEYALRMTSLECIVAVLRSLHSWSHKGMTAAGGATISIAASDSTTPTGRHSSVSSLSSIQQNDFVDDPSQFEDLKLQKSNLEGGIRMFNQSPKRGMAALIKSGFVASSAPEDIAKFLIETDGLDKAKIGDYLGGHEKENVEIMYAFVDHHDFTGMRYVDALRIFLQSFRLPGEAQKIDRFLLKFAQRYISGNPDSAFVNAESAYVLAYSVVMLNVDQHSTKVKNRMKPENFVSNNRGINEGGDLPPELLLEIFEEIQKNEIKLDSEQADAAISNAFEAAEQPTGIAATLGFGKDVNKEAYLKAAKEMTSKTEQLFRGSSSTNDEPGLYYVASHFEHVRPMFDSVWMSVVAALSGPLHTSDDEETVKLCLDGIKYSIKISCLFDIELPRESFVNTLAKFTSLSQLHEMRQKNIEAIKVLLEVAVSDGAGLKRGWKDILTCVSQLERCQLIVGGVSATAIPDINDARIHGRASLDRRRTLPPNMANTFTPEVEAALKSESLNKLTDKIFVQSASLPVDSCVDFVRALAEVSWQEIKSSAGNENPRTFSLQKMVDVSYYNMGRIKMEWTPIWAVMGAQFNKVGTIPNTMIVFMALDSLRQLAGRFLDLEELSHFKFQKDFLQPFEYIMEKNSSGEVKDMVLQCIRQLLLSKKSAFRSGWISVFNVCGAATSSSSKSLLNTAFDIVKKAREQLLTEVILQDAFVPMTKCLTAIAMNQLSQKTALHAIEQLKAIIVDVSNDKTEDNGVPHPQQLPRLWMPVFQSFHDIIMTGEDLEVRSRALNYLFDVLVQYGGGFEADSWDTICTEVLFPIFVILKSRSEMARFNNQDDVSVWLSTTMIQALRNMIALFTHYFSTLDRMLDGFLDLLVTCINQENDTVSRIGSTCLQQLITENVNNFNDAHWAKIVDTFGELFKTNTAVELFESTRKPDDPEDKPQRTDKQKIFKTIIVKCILQLLAIDTVEGLFQDQQVYQCIPTKQLLRITDMLQESYTFSKTFNADKDLRMRLWKEGFMKQYPNLFRQESHSVSTYLHLTFKVYLDPVKTTTEQHDAIGKQLLPLALELMEMYAALDFDQNKEKVISTWTPVIVSVLQNYARFPDSEFNANAEDFFKLSLNLLEKDVSLEVRVAVKHILHRVGQLYMKGKGKE
ncbi:YALIA101S06e04214g1_1 [Yarrowia lipolytica]|jgi:brefeldin A-inhibited guanine nucleotide-exchange protein|nr:Protein transport protein sec72 [Yarrowia lipolytica]SEI35194.1 YALIA101S06e04214g1_1 [Yarrowia lipolytica]